MNQETIAHFRDLIQSTPITQSLSDINKINVFLAKGVYNNLDISEFILEKVSAVTGVPLPDFCSANPASRKQAKYFARRFAMYFIRKYTKLSYRQIALKVCPNRPLDHSTVIHAIKSVKIDIEANNDSSNFQKHYRELSEYFSNNGLIGN